MGYDWNKIYAQKSPEAALYRLLGEMMQRAASDADLARIEEFLAGQRPDHEGWKTLGEALYHATSGDTRGFRIWTRWTRRLTDHVDYESLLRIWQGFGDELSDPQRATVEMPAGFIGENVVYDDVSTELDIEEISADALEPVDPEVANGLVSASTPELMSYLPTGRFTIRFLDQIYEGVDEFALLALLRRGLLLGVEVAFADRWMPLACHPAFEGLVRALSEELRHVVGGLRNPADEVTRPSAPDPGFF